MKKGVDHIGVSVVYFCHDGKGNVLFAKRSQNARDEKGIWDIGAGGIEFGDTVEKTLRKEIKEEYNADVLDFEFLGYRDVHRLAPPARPAKGGGSAERRAEEAGEHEGHKTHWIALDFKVLIDPEGVKINESHKFDDIGWFTLDNLPKPGHSQFPEFLEKYRKKL